jgi:mannonate dehydratase
MKRRQFVTLAGLAGLGTVVSPGLAREQNASGAGGSGSGHSTGPVLGCQRAPTDARRLQHFKRHGVDHICGYPDNEADPASWTVESLMRLRERCAAQGVSLDMVQFPMLSSASIDRMTAQHDMNPQLVAGLGKAIMLGKDPERQREIEFVQSIIRNCARAGIPAIKYNMNLLGVLRTADTPGRGGTRYSTWRLSEAKEEPPLTAAGVVSAETAWERITYFLERVVPVATEHKVRLACHPHDPGVPPRGFRGVVRVLGTVDGMKRFVDIASSPYHGLNLCVGTTAEMLQTPSREIEDVIRYFGERKKIFNIHFRNIRGRRDDFQETFPDEGDMDMVAVMRTLKQVGYQFMVMPDHLPRHADDPRGDEAFAFGYGYIKALLQATS